MQIEHFHFPRLKFADENDIFKQLQHIDLERKEVWDAFYEPSIEHFAEEIGDLAQSCMTMLYIIERIYGIHPLDVIERNNVKNAARNYLRRVDPRPAGAGVKRTGYFRR